MKRVSRLNSILPSSIPSPHRPFVTCTTESWEGPENKATSCHYTKFIKLKFIDMFIVISPYMVVVESVAMVLFVGHISLGSSGKQE